MSKDYRKGAPNTLKEEIDVSFFTNESVRNDAINIIRCQKIKDLEQWVGYSFKTDPLVFFEKLLLKFGLPGLKTKNQQNKWINIKGKLLYLRIYEEILSNQDDHPDYYVGVEKIIRCIKDKYPEYKKIKPETLIARYHDTKLKCSESMKTLKKYIESSKTSKKHKLVFIRNLIQAIENTCKSEL